MLTSNETMQFAVIGCGTIAQVMHLPYLAELPEASIHALVDPAENRVEELGERYNVPHRYQTVDELLTSASDQIDAAIVLTPAHTHADVVVKTLNADIHTLVEKPLAVTLEDANRMIETANASDAVSMVAYMKRFDPAYEQAHEHLKAFDNVDVVTSYDVDPDHGRIIREVYNIVDADLSNGFVEESATERRNQIARAIDTDDDELINAYDFQLDHVCHDINALRGLFGKVTNVSHVDVFSDGRYATAHLEYENDVRCVLETGDSDRKWFEQFIRVDGPEEMLKLDFSNPFIRNTPTDLRLKRGVKDLEDTAHTPSYDEPFKRELEHFLECVRSDNSVRTPFDEARDDLRVIIDLFKTYQQTELESTHAH
ncbi:Gfo/Idh/MocA family protein [Haladaptatus caseinilyticus]|uniref:Gfo/Idh/MocA family protein n=1 Tax=Haladaptatus caseinilyticus TaxID=2993314 RepID=UPI002E229BCF